MERLNDRIRQLDPFGDVDKREMIELFSHTVQVLDKAGINSILVFGGLLGYARTRNKLLPWDDDIDLGVLDKDCEEAKNVLNRSDNLKCVKYYVPDIYLSGKHIYKVCFSSGKSKNFYENYSYPFIDIYEIKLINKERILKNMEKKSESPMYMYYPLTTKNILFEGVNVKIPFMFTMYLDQWYGNNWRYDCISTGMDHKNTSLKTQYKVQCSQLTPLLVKDGRGHSHPALKNVILVSYDDDRTAILSYYLKRDGVVFQVVYGDEGNQARAHIEIRNKFLNGSKNTVTVLEDFVTPTYHLTSLPHNLPDNWDIISLNNCFPGDPHCCASYKNIGSKVGKYHLYENEYPKIHLSYCMSRQGAEKIECVMNLPRTKLRIFGLSPNATKECFKSVDRYVRKRRILVGAITLAIFIVAMIILIKSSSS
jgi:hypothetical protein